MESIHFIGYHGTKCGYAKQILEERHFKPSKKSSEWLGRGIYFFKDDVLQALFFAGARYSNEKYNIRVLKARIESASYFDLTITKHRDSVYRMLSHVLEALAGKNPKLYKVIVSHFPELKDGLKEHASEGYVLDLMYRIKPYDLVICPYEVPKQKAKQAFRFKPTQMQVCIKDDGCIDYDSLEEVSESEYRPI